MIDPGNRDDEAIDRLVRAHLDREAQRADSASLLARIRQGRPRLSGDGGTPSRGVRAPGSMPARWPRRLGWVAAAAAITIGAFLGGRHLSPAQAHAATILRDVRASHSLGIDRCYRVQFAPDPRSWDGSALGGPSESVLWTRGDGRFWSDCSIADLRLAIGREADGTFWVSTSPTKGIRFEGGEGQMPEDLAMLCDINSLTVPSLVDDVLADFEFHAQGPSSREGGATSLVLATLKAGRSHPLLSAALLEVDPRGDALLRLVLWTVRDGKPHGTVTYTLLDDATRGPDQYRLESHLDPDAEVEAGHFETPRADGPAAGE